MCKTNFCVAFLCPFYVVEHRPEYDPFIERFWSLPVQENQKMLLDLNGRSTLVVRAKRIALLKLPNSIFRQIYARGHTSQFCCPIVVWIWI